MACQHKTKYNEIEVKQEIEREPIKTEDHWLREWSEAEIDRKDFKVANELDKYDAKQEKVKHEEEHEAFSKGILDDSRKINKYNKTAAEWNLKNKISKNEEAYNNLFKDALLSDKVENMCKFQCVQCDSSVSSWKKLKSHCKQNHQGKKPMCAEIQTYMRKTFCHICKICSEKVLCDLVFMGIHLRKHKINLVRYREQYFFDSNKILPGIIYSNKIVGSLCVFKCSNCEHEFHSKSRFKWHQRQYSHYSKNDNGDNFLKRVYHKCKFCMKSILCEKTVLMLHFRRSHSLSFAEYCKRTGCSLSTKTIANSSSYFLKSLKNSSKIDDLCVFQCKICKKKFFKSSSFYSHTSKKHPGQDMSLSESLVMGCWFKCEMCSLLMLCDKATIRTHLKRSHNYNIGEEVTSLVIKQYDDVRNKFLANTPVSLKVWETPTICVNKIPIEERTSKIGNMCQFKCPRCNETFIIWRKLRTHLKITHNKTICYNSSMVVTARYHCCLICPSAVLSDRAFLSSHVQTNHKMRFQEYEKIFRQNGGEVLPSFIYWRQHGEQT